MQTAGHEKKGRTRNCERHRNRKASHHCQACGADRCVNCTFEAEGSRGFDDDFSARCGKCGGFAEIIRVHRAENKSYFARVLAAPLYPLSASGAAMLVATAVFTYLVQFILCFGGLLGQAVLWSIFFALLRQTAQGSDRPEVPEFSSVWGDLLVPLGRGIAATALLWLPAAVYLYSRLTNLVHVDMDEDALTRTLFVDPVLWLIIAAGFVYMPMALIVAGMGGNVWQMLNPVRIVAYARRTIGDYLVAVAAVVVLGIVWALFSELLVVKVKGLGIFIISGLIAQLFTVYPIFVGARVLGLFAFVRGDELDIGHQDEYYEPAVEDARPTGRPGPGIGAQTTSDPSAPGAYRSSEPIELQTDATPVAMSASSASASVAGAATATAPSSVSAIEMPIDPGQAIMSAVELRDTRGAIALYRDAVAGGTYLVEPPVHLEIGRVAAGAGDFDLARFAMEAAVTINPAHEVVPRAMVLLARLNEQLLGDPARALELFREVVQRFPGTPAAAFATDQLRQKQPGQS